MMPRGGCIFWYTRKYLYKYDYVMDFNLMVMLRSTTGSYGRPMIDVAYGETIFHSTEAVREMVAREEWLGCRHDASPIFDILSYVIFVYLFTYRCISCFLTKPWCAHTHFLLNSCRFVPFLVLVCGGLEAYLKILEI